MNNLKDYYITQFFCDLRILIFLNQRVISLLLPFVKVSDQKLELEKVSSHFSYQSKGNSSSEFFLYYFQPKSLYRYQPITEKSCTQRQ